ncbi:MAG: ABC transporter substrate-binding protein [Duodenibacillus sp.]|nr:ABC transporter substrate-binding protein [Duodenibacillus sp.]
MNKLTLRIAACAAAALAAGALCARTVVDHDGHAVELPDAVERAVVTNIYPLASVTTVFLGGPEKLAGIHKVSMGAAKSGLLSELYPGIAKAETGFMTGTSLNIESLMKLRPQVVFVNARDAKAISQLEAAGIPHLCFSTTKWNYDAVETFDRWIELLEAVFPGQSRVDAAAVRSYSQEKLKLIRDRVGALPAAQKKRILFLFTYDADRIVTSGRNFFGQYWCDAVGGVNVAEGVQAKHSNAMISMEQIYAWNPDVVFVTNFTPAQPEDVLQSKRHDWSQVKAVKEGKVYKMPLGVYRSYTPGIDTPVTLLWLAKKTYPEAFADIDLAREIRAYYKRIFNVDLTDAQIERITNPKGSIAKGFKPV